VSHLALPEVLRLFFVSGLLSRRDRHGAVAAPLCFQALRNSSGSLAIFTAIRRASSLLSSLAAERRIAMTAAECAILGVLVGVPVMIIWLAFLVREF
jgi:hypothetical protein